MKFIVSTTPLLRQLQLISGVISSNTVLPILENFLFDVRDGKMSVSSTDLETSMTTEIAVQSQEEGKIAVPAKTLLDILKNLPDQPLTFSVNLSNFGIEIKSENGKYKLTGESGEEYPKIPTATDLQNTTLPAKALAEAIRSTVFAVSNDELRPAMTGVYVQLSNEGTTFVATDAHKLVRYKRHDARVEQNTNFIIPKKALNLLKNSLPSDDTAVTLSYNNNNAFFAYDSTLLICRLIDAKYPDYNAVIPFENNNKMTINRQDFQNSLRRIAIFSNKTTNQVVLKIAGSELQVSAQDIDFANEASERLGCQYSGADMEIAFNAKFLIEMLTVLEGEEVNLEMSTPNRAGIILPGERDEQVDLLMLIMPVMIHG